MVVEWIMEPQKEPQKNQDSEGGMTNSGYGVSILLHYTVKIPSEGYFHEKYEPILLEEHTSTNPGDISTMSILSVENPVYRVYRVYSVVVFWC